MKEYEVEIGFRSGTVREIHRKFTDPIEARKWMNKYISVMLGNNDGIEIISISIEELS